MRYGIIILIIFFCQNLSAQKVTGTLKISVENGTLEGDFTITELPIVENYKILINSGLNIQYFKDQDNKNIKLNRQYDPKISYESFLYTFPNRKDRPKSFSVKYAGKFPVHKDTTEMNSSSDWKGNIAFSENTLRMDGNQTSWYPVLYDVDNDKRYSSVKYSIEIICNDCSALYLNGNEPIYSSRHTFKSENPIDISLFVGKYNFYKIDNNWFLNPDIDETQMKKFSKLTEDFKKFYVKKIGIPYRETIKFIQTSPTSKGYSFMFIDYPSIINIGIKNQDGLASLINDKFPEDKIFIAHELAHYYFGAGPIKFNTIIQGVICEGFAEYLSLKASQNVLSNDIYNSYFKTTLSNVKEKSYTPISEIKTYADYADYNSYTYDYFPIILTAIEQEIGEKKMWKWIKLLLTTETNFTDYEFLKNELVRAINDRNKSDRIIEKYFISDRSLENALEQIKIN